jgi:thiol-disulfide isomerase/thioredoxin
MKFSFTCYIVILFFSINALAKSTKVHITVKNLSGSVSVYDPELLYDLAKSKFANLHLDAHQPVTYTMDIDKPTFLVLYFSFNHCSLFLSPGDELFLTVDFSKKTNNIIVTGKGSNNNQPEIFALTNDMDLQRFKDDATPYRVIAAINKQFLLNKSVLANYIKINKPSTAFIKTAMINLQYFAPLNFYESHHSNAFGKPKDQQKKWQKIQDSLFSIAKLSNDDAFASFNYIQLTELFVQMKAGELWSEYQSNPTLFFKQWLHTDTTRGKKFFKSAPVGILFSNVIDKYFTGKAAEYAYGQSLKYEYYKADYPSVVWLFGSLKKKYPASVYIKGFSAPIAEVVNKQQQALNSKTIFVADNGTKLNTFRDVLALTKGKVALVDMWGTWCGPCREEIEKNAKQLRTHFKGKNITFLYIANRDNGKEKEWKKQIAYFQIEGVHILANPKLTTDIMEKVKATAYPTYIIVKKDGSYKQTTTKYPVNLQAMIKEIEAAAL